MEDLQANAEWKEELEEALEELCRSIEKSCEDIHIREGRNPDVDCIRLTLDPIRAEHRPLAFYAVSPCYFRLLIH